MQYLKYEDLQNMTYFTAIEMSDHFLLNDLTFT